MTSTKEDILPRAPAPVLRPEPPWRGSARMFLRNWAAVSGLLFLMIIIAVGLFGPALLSESPFEMVDVPLLPPGEDRLMGTDYLGRDVLAGIVHGARTTLFIGLASTAFTVLIGLSIGAYAGFYGGLVENLCMRVTEFFQVLPNLIFAMVLVSLSVPSLWTVIGAIGIVNWPALARLTRAEFLKLKDREFVLASRAAGSGNLRLIWLVILPNAMPPLVISMTLLIGICILFEAALSFLGLNDPEVMTWGLMIGNSRDYFWDAWWTVTFPGLAILLTVLSIALIGDGLNDALNPKLRER